MFLSRAAACRRILVPSAVYHPVVVVVVAAAAIVRPTVPRNSDRRASTSSSSSSSSVVDDVRRRRRRNPLHVGFAPSLFEYARPPPSSSNDDASPSSPSSSDARLVDMMVAALQMGVSNFDCPAPPSPVEGLVVAGADSRDASGIVDGKSRRCWMANRSHEIRIASALDRAMEMTRDDSIWDEEESGGRYYHYDDDDDDVVTLTSRIGYRSATISDGVADGNRCREEEGDDNWNEREGAFEGDSRVGMTSANTSSGDADAADVALVHNIGGEYVLHSLRTSPLVRKYKLDVLDNPTKEDDTVGRVRLVSLVHNPETQIASYLSSNIGATKDLDGAREYMRRRLTDAFVGYERAVACGWIDGYGVDSNGLGLPASHDMHVDWRDVLECAAQAYLRSESGGKSGRSSLRVVRLPGNLLETRGLVVANEIRSFVERVRGPPPLEGDDVPPPPSCDDDAVQVRKELKLIGAMRDVLPESLDVIATRPLAAYPHGGTGWDGLDNNSSSGPGGGGGGRNVDNVRPVRLIDYVIEVDSIGSDPIWSNELNAKHGIRPAAYQPILNAALAHFDAYDILEASHDRELTVEERETLDGCKLLRDMLHDMDASLDSTRSFDAYEDHLMNVAVPLIYGTFEELDEESALILQKFFKAHGMAVRMAVARWTRDLLLAGWNRIPQTAKDGDGSPTWEKDSEKERIVSYLWKSLGFGNFDGGYPVPDDVTLQEFALKQLLKGEGVGGVVVGFSSREHVLEAISAVDTSCADLK